MNELISIIIPAYNCEKYIERCLDSLINQTYKNIEIIIVNDGSKDKTLDLVKIYEIKDKRIKIIDKKNEGVSVARNIGIEVSLGKYITFVDADDWLEKNAIELMHKEIIEKDVDVVRCNYYIDDGKDFLRKSNLYELANRVIEKKDFAKQQVLEHFLFVENSIANLVMLLLIRSDIIKNKINFDKELYMMEDVFFYQELFQNIEKIYFLDMPLYHYYINNNSATKSNERYEKNILGIIEVNKKLRLYLTENNILVNKIKKLNANHLKMISNYLFMINRCSTKNKISEIISRLRKNGDFLVMVKNINLENIPIQNKLVIFLIQNNLDVILYIFFIIKNSYKRKEMRK